METYLPNNYILNCKYKILEGISVSDFSNIYIVEHINKKYILKEYFPKNFSIRMEDKSIFTEKNRDKFERMKNNFLNEIYNLRRLKNRAGIVEIFDFFSENNTEYILMEYCLGKNLKEYITNEKNISIEKILKIFLKILKIVNRIHMENILHLDIKPSNIVIDEYENIKIIDFGSSIKLRYDFYNGKKKLKTRYISEEIVVSNGYSPLELYSREKKIDKRSDIYSLLCILYFMLSKKNPPSSIDRFLEDTLEINEIFFKYFFNCDEEIDNKIKNKYYKLLEVIEKGLSVKKEKRYGNIGQIIHILEKLF